MPKKNSTPSKSFRPRWTKRDQLSAELTALLECYVITEFGTYPRPLSLYSRHVAGFKGIVGKGFITGEYHPNSESFLGKLSPKGLKLAQKLMAVYIAEQE